LPQPLGIDLNQYRIVVQDYYLFSFRALHLPHATSSAMDAHCETVSIWNHVTQIAAYR